jgi:hypothetical protein
MLPRLSGLTGLLWGLAALAAPIRADKNWAVHAQLTPADWHGLVQPGNLAAGKVAQAEPAPNDANTGSDLKQLTDGILAGAEGRMWSDKRAVGWAYQEYARLTLDLGQSQPLGQVLIRLQVISKDSTLPRTITVSLSNDGDTFSPVRNLSAKTHPEDDPARTYEPLPVDPPGIYAVALDLGYEARFLRLDFALRGYLVTDELALIPATGAVQQLPPAPKGQREYLDNVFDRRDQYRKMTAAGNLVLGLPLRYAPTPTQYLNVDEADPQQLTDGKFGERTDERIWFERGCVGWQGPSQVTLFADLGQVQPLAAVVLRLLGGAEQNALEFPDEITVLLSDNGTDYYQAAARHKRGLDDLSADAYDLPEVKLAWVHNFRVPVGQKARYLAVQVRHQKQFVVSDEMAVVKGGDDLPAFRPEPGRRVTIVTHGVAFTPVWGNLPVCQNLPLRGRLLIQDARAGADYGKPCKVVLDLPETVRFASAGPEPTATEHQGRAFKRYLIDWRGEGTDFYLQSLLPAGKTDILYTYGDSGAGPENERQITWESLVIPPARIPKRLHVSLSWAEAPELCKVWPDYLAAQRHLGFNAVGMQPCYWNEANVPAYQAFLEEARQKGFQLIQIESPAGAVAPDRSQPEIKSVLPGGKFGSVCPAYRGQYYQKEGASFARAAVWIKPDILFYDIEAYWSGAQEAPQCSRCLERFKAGNYPDWDAFRAAMGREMHVDMKVAIEKALAAAGITRLLTYGSYRTEPVTPLNDGLFAFANTYPDLLQMAMPSLYVAGNPLAVATSIAANRACMQSNDIIPWLSTGCYGEYDPVRTRDMILEAFANGSRGITYYWYGHFDAAHFKYHAEAVDLVAPIEDIFMDGKPLTGLSCNHAKVKVCGMGVGNEMAVLVSNYSGLAPATKVTVQTPAPARTPVWDLHRGEQIGKTDRKGAFTVAVGSAAAHLYYLGTRYADAVPRR